MTTTQAEMVTHHSLIPAVLDLDEADRNKVELDLMEIEKARDILSGILDRHKGKV